jgi:hypothetical protein
MRLSSLLSFAAILFTQAAGAQAVPPVVPHPNFVEEYKYFTTDAQYEAWSTLTTGLRSDFDNICGDTFCEGDYSNLQSLSFDCSVDQASGRIGRCVWIFAGSYEGIDPATGAITVDARTWNCPTPLAPRTTMTELLAALAVSHPLQTPLPRTQTTIYDGLIDCL